MRGYKESGLVADGGVIASAQYEFDLVKYNERVREIPRSEIKGELNLRKLAPLAFFDYGRAKIEDNQGSEHGAQDLYSVGVGGIVELGENIVGAVYYGWPLEATTTTDTKDGRLNLSVMVRW